MRECCGSIVSGSAQRRGASWLGTHEEGDGSIEVGDDNVLGILVLCLVLDLLAHDGLCVWVRCEVVRCRGEGEW